MVKKIAVKQWLNIVTLFLVILVLFFARNDLLKAWYLLGQVNLLMFLLIIPLQFLSYYASGAMVFTYLKSHGDDLKHISPLEQPKIALEFNFVNHVFPSAGVSGASYMTYRLNRLGVNTGRATLAQVVRFIMQFASFAALMVIAVVWVTLDGNLTRFTILIACTLLTLILGGTIAVIFLLGNLTRLEKFEAFLDMIINKKIARFVRHRGELVKHTLMHKFVVDMHKDYLTLRANPKWLVKPFWWGALLNITETMMFFVTFLSLGTYVNPAPILIALGLGALIGVFLPTPGGAGGYEAAVILFLTSAGVPTATSVAGVLLARTSLILLTIGSGYVFYNAALRKYGKPTN